MDDGEVAVVTADEIQVFDALGQPVEKQHSYVDWDVSAAEKGGYAHFMFKEIMEQPEAVRKTISPRIKNKLIEFEELSLSDEYIASLSKIFIIACGSPIISSVCSASPSRSCSRPNSDMPTPSWTSTPSSSSSASQAKRSTPWPRCARQSPSARAYSR